ncbi:MAG TPA: hypothetical protein VHS31_14570, partial [Tepidisphaeraceae bacterium]|nr:hypothetical protein [Tepidisphaeraceae bacterium]
MIQKLFSAISHGCDDSFASSAKSPRRVVSAAIISLTVALSGVFLAMSQVAFAGSITYPNPTTGSFPGNTVIYGPDLGPADHGVTESSMTDAVPLYGSPTVTGDSMSFTPSGFGSFSQNGGLDITDGQLVFKVL